MKSLSAVVGLCLLATPLAVHAKQPLTLGINKAVGAAEAEKAGETLPKVLGEKLGREVKVAVVSDYESLVSALLLGKIDLAWMSPLAYVQAKATEPGLVPIAKAIRHGSVYYRSVIVVPADSTAKSINDLEGKRIAWVSKSSASGYLFPLALLKKQGVDADFFGEQKFAGSHDAACVMLMSGQADAAATFADEPEEGKPLKADGCGPLQGADKLKVVYKTGPISNDVLVARPGLKGEAKAIAAALQELGKGEAGKKALNDVFRADGFGLAEESDFTAVEQASKALEMSAEAPR